MSCQVDASRTSKHSHHVTHMHKSDKSSKNSGQGLFPKTKIFTRTKNYKKNLQGLKSKLGNFAGTNTIFYTIVNGFRERKMYT